MPGIAEAVRFHRTPEFDPSKHRIVFEPFNRRFMHAIFVDHHYTAFDRPIRDGSGCRWRSIDVPDTFYGCSEHLLINATANTNNNVNGTIGFAFAAANAPAAPTIKGLGFVDAGDDGLAASHQVGLYHWNGSVYTLERSVTISTGTAFYLNGGYRWYPITDYTLTDSNPSAYFLAATVGSGDGDFWGGNGSADMTSVGNNTLNAGYNTTAGSQSSSLLPSTWNGSFPGNTFYNAPNATVNTVPLPEPSTYCMALAGLACGGYSMWQRRKRS